MNPDPSAGSTGLSGGVTAGIAALGGGAILAVAALFWSQNQRGALLIILGAIVLAALVLLAYAMFLKWRAARQSKPFSETVERAAGDTPNTITNPGSRAKLDDLRRNFETGLSRFRAAGKDLYKLPWYLLVGEPGSGKTEAIRHSSIPFPPGLQDQLQGSGGTVNMNWWFTNDAVILDTAGRYMFNEVQAGASTEWTEFLRLLLRNRPQCPINGLLLVIPANSLILDTADQIEAKGGQIAQQLDRIQRTLEVRFPVYIVVTKCDLVNGFREFFDGLNDPRLQHQILGWSNPAPLDQPFNPELVDEHLKSVAVKLSQRRLGLLLDPVAREAEQSRRIDEVDSLYSLPESFLRLGPRLRRYLEMIFVAGEWSPKPLFLRGIYFTSSMREGQAIDAELMELLHVPVESLREGRLWERDRAFFLRDLFLKKVFPERGLVTRAASTAKLQRTRTLALLGGGFVAAALLVFFTWFGSAKLKESIGAQGVFWQEMADKSADANRLAIIEPVRPRPGSATTAPTYHCRLDDPLPESKTKQTVGDMYGDLLNHQRSQIYVHPVLKPASKLLGSGGDLNTAKDQDYRLIFQANALAPLLSAAGQKAAAQDPKTWDARATDALTQLIGCRQGKPISIEPLLDYVAPDAAGNQNVHDKYLANLQDGESYLEADGKLLPEIQQIVPKKILDAAAQQFVQHWKNQLDATAGPFDSISSANGPIEAVNRALSQLHDVCLSICKDPPKETDQYVAQKKNWRDAIKNYRDAQKSLSEGLAAIGPDAAGTSLATLYRNRNSQALEEARAAYKEVLDNLPPEKPESTDTTAQDVRPGLINLRKRLEGAEQELVKTAVKSDLSARLTKQDSSLLKMAQLPDGPKPTYDVIGTVFQKADAKLPDLQAPGTVDGAEAQLILARKDIDDLTKLLPENDQTKNAAQDAQTLLVALAGPADRYMESRSRLQAAPRTVEDIEKKVAASAGAQPVADLPPIPFITWPADAPSQRAAFDPSAAAAYLPTLRDRNDPPGPTTSAGDCSPPASLNQQELDRIRTDISQATTGYLHQYTKYWMKIANSRPIIQDLKWDELLSKFSLGAVDVDHAFETIAETLSTVAAPANASAEKAGADLQSLNAIEARAKAAEAALSKPETFDEALEHWKALGRDPIAARIRLISQTNAQNFAIHYMLLQKHDSDFVTAYWQAVSEALLNSLISNADAPAKLVSEWIARNQRFPIGPQKGDISQKELEELRRLLSNVVSSDTAESKPDTILKGDRLFADPDSAEHKLNDELDRLVKAGISPQDHAKLEKLNQLLNALPPEGQQYTCTISLVGPKEIKEQNLKSRYESISGHFPHGSVKLVINGQLTSGEPSDLSQEGSELGSAQYPNDKVQLAVFKIPDDWNSKKVTVYVPEAKAGIATIPPWQLLHLLVGNAQRTTKDSASFYVETPPANVQGQPRSIWIKLRFEKPLPDVKDWMNW